MSAETRRPKVLAVASKGGHWQQMMQLLPAFSESDVTFGSTDQGLAQDVAMAPFVLLKDYNQNEKGKVLAGLFETFGVLRRVNPDCVISTGAAPGLLCLLWGRIMGKRTIWIDSIANGEELSLSGRLAKKFSTDVLTQWEHLAESEEGVEYWGSVI